MIIHDCVQGTSRWRQLRLGRPTASEFSRIVTPTGKLSTQATDYMNKLLAEAMLGHEIEAFQSKWMKRGSEYEGEAVKAYEFDYECETERIGFVTNDAGTIGASPDRRVSKNSGLEIKCPAPNTQIARLISGLIDDTYNPQLQGQLLICEWDWIDNLYYHPELPRSIIRVPRDEPYIAILHDSLSAFVDQMAAKRALLEKKFSAFPVIELDLEPPNHGGLGITDEDVNEILQEIAGRNGFTG